jgi:hypothetical protein
VGSAALALASGILLTVAGYSRVCAADSTLPASTTRHELACRKYDANTFIGDQTVIDQLTATRVAGKEMLALPCSENVSGSVVTAQPIGGTAAGNGTERPIAAKGSLNVLFSSQRTPLERFQNGFDLYSWLTFLALNLPADAISAPGAFAAVTAWEKNFFPLDEVMKTREGVSNFSLKNPPESCTAARKQDGGPEPTLFVSVDEVAFNQPFKTGPLVDKDGEYSLNTIFVNLSMQKYVANPNHVKPELRRHLDTLEGQREFPGVIEFPPGNSDTGALGAMMIKASWKVLGPRDDPSEFHTARAYRYFPEGQRPSCDIRTLGLIGFHVVHKTANRHQWIWTTFEHVRNVPSAGEVASGHLSQSSYFFYYSNGATANETPPHPWDPLHPPRIRSQIVRAQDIGADAQTINQSARESLTQHFKVPTFWTHYQLISTQWPADFDCAREANGLKTDQQADPSCSPAPTFLPNSTLETYIQHDIGASGGVPQSTSSCIACHNNAVAYQRIDFGDGKVSVEGDLCPSGKINPTEGLTQACSPASDFTFILEQVCAPMTDPSTGRLDPRRCLRDH